MTANTSKRRRKWLVPVVAGVVAVGGGVAGAVVYFTRETPTRHVQQQKTHASAAEDAPMPYVNYVNVRKEHRGKIGVTVFDKDKAEPGYGLYIAKPDNGARLIDIQGEIVHQWSSAIDQPTVFVPLSYRGWYTVRMTPKGDIYTMVTRKAVLKLDWNSKVLWRAAVPAHHDIIEAPDGKVYVLTEEARYVEIEGKKRLIADDRVAILSAADGSVERRISFFDIFMGDPVLKPRLEAEAKKRFRLLDKWGLEELVARRTEAAEENEEDAAFKIATLAKPSQVAAAKKLMAGEIDDSYETNLLMRAIPGNPGDLFHGNTIVYLRADPSGLWNTGDLMISSRHFNTLIVFDPKDLKVKWTWGPGELGGQHQPSQMANGHILVFDNGRLWTGSRADERGTSRVIEVDPATKKIVWQYEGTPPRAFFAVAEGGAQQLPKGNVLITDASLGRVFEVTPEKRIVWDFFNPKFANQQHTRRSGIYRFQRYPPEIVEPLLKSGAAAASARGAASAAPAASGAASH